MMRHRGVPDAGSTPSPGPAAARGRTSAELTQLVRGASIGDQAAFAQLYDATAPRVYGLALRILAELSRVQREALKLAYFDGCRYSEVGACLGLPRGTAAAQIRDGLIGLRKLLEDQ